MRYAIVEPVSGIVVNVVEWDGDTASWVPPEGYTMVPDQPPSAGPGFSYVDGKFVPPPSGTPAAAEPA